MHPKCHHHRLARLITTGDITLLPSLRLFVSLLVRFPDHPSSLTLSRLLPRRYFHLHPSSTTFLYNLLIRSFSRSRHPDQSVHLFRSMLQDSSFPDNFTFPSLTTANATRNSPREGSQSHCQLLRRGFLTDSYALNTLISMYAAFRDMGSAHKVFDSNPQARDAVPWNTILNGYVRIGSMEVARSIFDEMPVRNEISCSEIISGYTTKGEMDAAQEIFDRMPAGRSIVTWNSMLTGFARRGMVLEARRVFDEMPERNLVSWNSMVSGYCLNGEMDAARKLFDLMVEKDVVSWSCMISGYAQSNHYRKALQLFKEMQTASSVRPNEVTMVSVLSACAHLAALDQGKWVHAYIDKNQMVLDRCNLGAALVDMYAKCGSMGTAMELFKTLDHQNVSSWNALITGLAVNGAARESLDAFELMARSEARPDDITFLGVLTACTHGGLVNEGRMYFESMLNVYGVKPEMKHYGCMVDMLGRAGLLEEAERVIRSMPMKPDVMVVGALLSACRIHKNVKIADSLRSDLLELNSDQAGCHVLLSNIYAAAGRWIDAEEMRGMLNHKRIKKEPGSSSVELYGTVYEFIAGDHSLQKNKALHSWLDEMTRKLKSEGYSPDTGDVLLDLNEEDKETWVSRHSEKLALAFALLKGAPHQTVRIVKNLRICADCHTFMKCVSRSCLLEILVRDRIRFHHFKDGSCSCKEYW